MATSFELGEIRIDRVIEQEGPFMDMLQFLPGLTPELLGENRGWLEQAGAIDSAGMMVICIQSYVIRTPHHKVLIDTCVGNHKDRPTRPGWHQRSDDSYMRSLAAAGLGVGDIDFVLCTHLHPDHVGWNTQLRDGRWVPTFPNARYVFSAKELAAVQASHAQKPLPIYDDSVLPILEADRAVLVRSDHALDDHIRLTPTPGHTIDHFAVEIGTPEALGAVTGDLIHSPLQARYPELSMKFDHDQQQSAATRRAFLERHCDSGALICTAHFPSPSVGHLTRWGEGFRLESRHE